MFGMTYRLAGYDDDVYMISLRRYFIWDTIDAIVNFTDLGFVLHGERSFVCTHKTHAVELMGRFLTFLRDGVHVRVHPDFCT